MSGEVINPASVQINGIEVIDSRGTWVGGGEMGGGGGGDNYVRNDQNGSIAGSLSVDALDSSEGIKVRGALIIDGDGRWLGLPSMSNVQVRDALTQVDGVGSGVDADLLDGRSSSDFIQTTQSGVMNGSLTVKRLISAEGIQVNGKAVIDSAGRVKPSLPGGIYMGFVNGGHSYIKHIPCSPGGPNDCSTLQLKVGNETGNDKVSVYSRFGIALNGPGNLIWGFITK